MIKDIITYCIATVIVSCVAGIFCTAIAWAVWKFDVWRSPCTRVYNGEELIYEGKSAFYNTESRGTSTIYQEHQKRFLFPRMVKEIISDKITAETISCE